ncbi:HDOD domain-containing protein [Malaciobacter mytili]|uniref:HDOD domain-containing protein n=1 Tax=Malaciobacter mytili LMG 24559 TaxID=1032238 RepID=A0AAX2AKC0_9BACT|nr:HDOD domain-containing protein [Malaciobacter mytili]AXH14524.1 HDOD domain-containing protein [Malaciobacter mytili LMG 24559]RXI37048.1 HDOD domain-containing protein [Malaciobacter mytili]RXK16578.1 HDOD domain-containing protein [Malaciobacter mytili LMG 24559]
MSENILERIESLPPLPKTIAEIEEFRQKRDKEAFELLKIIEKDALIISTLLKVSNSAMFGFRSKVETPSRAINLLGINFTISIAIGGTVQNLLKANLSPYGINSDDFMRVSNMATTLTNLWLSKVSYDLKEELILPALLQEAGKFVIADILELEGKTSEFQALLSQGYSTAQAEKELLGLTTSEITARIFRHWKLSDTLINSIEFVDDLSNVDEAFRQRAEILNVVKTACEVNCALSDESIQNAIEKAKEFNLDVKALEIAIEKLQDRLLDEE